MTVAEPHIASRYNKNWFYIGRGMRGYTNKGLAEATGIPYRAILRYASGTEPTPEHLKTLCEVLQVPPGFFFRPGQAMRQYAPLPTAWEPVFPEDPRPLRERAAAMLANVPDDALPELLAFLDEIVEYDDKVTRLKP